VNTLTINDIMILIGAVFFFLLVIIGITELGAWLRHRSLMKNLQKNPQVAEKLIELESKAKVKHFITELIPKRVKVVVVQKDGSIIEDICKNNGEFITCKTIRMQFPVSSDIKPIPSLVNKKIMLTYYYSQEGKPLVLKVNENEVELDAKAPDPRMTNVIINKHLLEQVFRHLGVNMSSVILGMGLGAMLIVIVIFFILPLTGTPVLIGKQVVEVIHTNTPMTTPPPGNYTVMP